MIHKFENIVIMWYRKEGKKRVQILHKPTIPMIKQLCETNKPYKIVNAPTEKEMVLANKRYYKQIREN